MLTSVLQCTVRQESKVRQCFRNNPGKEARMAGLEEARTDSA
jgi:hypothetical protein